MSRIWAIARLNLLALVRDRSELVGVIVLPLLLTWVFGTAFGSQGPERALQVPVADLDGSRYSRQVVSALDAEKAYDVVKVSEAIARQQVADGDVPAVMIVEKGFGDSVVSGKKASVEVLTNPGATNGQAVLQVVEGACARVAAGAEAARATRQALEEPVRLAAPATTIPAFQEVYEIADGFWEPEPPVGVKADFAVSADGRTASLEIPANTQFSLGFTVFFVFMVALGSAGGVLEERELGTLRRMLSAPLTRFEILAGKVAGVALVAAFEASILVGLGAVVFGVPWGAHPLATGAMLAALIFSATGLGVMISALVRTRAQMSAITPVLSTALAMLGGCYWSIEIASPLMQKIAWFTPTGWAMVGLKDAVARSGDLGSVLVPVSILAAFGAVSLLLGMMRLRLE